MSLPTKRAEPEQSRYLGGFMNNAGVLSTCSQCDTALTGDEWHCPACGHFLGAPNVRTCSASAELDALAARAKLAEDEASQRGCLDAAQAFSAMVHSESGVVVALPPNIALNLVSDPRSIYQNYEQLVEGGSRTPAQAESDRKRRAVGGLLFGSYAREIRYGALTLDNMGPPSYGEISFRLRNITVQNRVSFTETNTYDFVDQHGLTPGKEIPKGYRAIWRNRDQLALAKLGRQLSNNQAREDWSKLLLQSEGNRATDEFIEAHIFGRFNIDSIEDVQFTPQKQTSRENKLLAKLVLATFRKRSKGTAQKGTP